ncbi:phospho-N-acetylmuramoyl-pentapeptide-transferase [Leucobacter chromiireducens]|uniref:Phospho-N-acetylmuramoyl-pentapeptide-transferase n=1 Tax=Leucobacter chromiireducens subsp. chromiireducens TaxID=660067 RepID=A0ABS1SRK4_9MICO|nr:phospho-N-acetylmuramoyl-pentapeptide-transferase [Leucobacter chromiireducens]MBL3690779.1 phospho-N-acetylmuramoyl-pentapeptide-transferase [Leucobacter chromiireducens subsp. chromiireducens]
MIALLIAGGFSLLYSLLLTPVFVRIFNRLKWGQPIRVDGPKEHEVKRGTPTMGGIIFISGSVIAYFLGKLIMGETPTPSALLVILMAVGAGLVGFIDDFMKTRQQQSAGLGGWAKIAGQVIIAVSFALLGLQFANEAGLTPVSTHISLFRDLPFDFMSLGVVLGVILVIVWVMLIVTATTNAVNVTDGLDGLAAGSAIFAFGAYLIIGFWQSSQNCATTAFEAGCYETRDPMDLAVIAAAFLGGVAGFLWWNTNPAQIFMGDTGSMGIGGAIAALAILSRTELLLVLIGGLFIIETGSVIVQRLYFKVTKGKRIFLMSPIHHHFELKGWAEVTVVVRFWIIAGLFVVAGVGAFYGEWLLQQ